MAKTQESDGARPADERFLVELGLNETERAALRKQGSLSLERRGARQVSKLRFRLGGRQRVKVITGAERARRLAEVLVRWQAARRGELALARLSREAARKIRESKRRLEPLLDGRPFHFHGLTIRTAAVPKIGRNRE